MSLFLFITAAHGLILGRRSINVLDHPNALIIEYEYKPTVTQESQRKGIDRLMGLPLDPSSWMVVKLSRDNPLFKHAPP